MPPRILEKPRLILMQKWDTILDGQRGESGSRKSCSKEGRYDKNSTKFS